MEGRRKKYLHDMFFALGGDHVDPVIYIVPNEYSILSVKFIKNEKMEYTDYVMEGKNWVNKVIKTTKEDHYIIRTEEKIVGVIYNGKIDHAMSPAYAYYKKDRVSKIRYSIYITSDGPKIESQGSFASNCVLERDVPILLEKINGLEEYHHINQQNVYPYNRNDKFVVEWWYK
jgi:hypothetical protein